MAATVGVYRFGFDEGFAGANGDLADIAAFVGLPLVGIDYMAHRVDFLQAYAAWFNSHSMVVALVMFEGLTRSMKKEVRELAKTLTNILFFVLPVAIGAYKSNDIHALFAIVAFVVAAIVITPDRNKYIFGFRCENWFHYIIALCAVLIAQGLPIKY
jgi:chromate transport protein ChrA